MNSKFDYDLLSAMMTNALRDHGVHQYGMVGS